MTGENGVPETPDWVLPARDEKPDLSIPPNIILATE